MLPLLTYTRIASRSVGASYKLVPAGGATKSVALVLALDGVGGKVELDDL